MASKLSDDERIIKPGRALFAATGLRRVLAPDGLKITRDDFSKAAKIEPQIKEIVESFLDDKRENVPIPPYDHDDISNLLFQTMDPEVFTEKMARFKGHPAGDDFFHAADTAVTFLRSKAPRRFRSTFVGPQPVQPSKSELLTWRWYLETVGDPVWAIRQLLAATLGQPNIEALAAVWPDALESARKAAENGIADRLEKNPDLSFTRRQVRQLGVLTGNDPTAPPDVVQMLQTAFAAREQKPQPPPRPSAKPDDSMLTTVQKTANER